MTREELKTATNDELIDELNYCGYDSYFGEYRDNIITEIKKRMKEPVLDKIRAEIKEWYWQADKQALAKDPCVVDAMVDLFIRTIDKYKVVDEQ